MRIAVVGAGIVGVTSAYEFALQGHEVTVFERRGSVAAQASFAGGGLMAPGWLWPWASPGLSRRAVRSVFGRHPALRIGKRLDGRTVRWGWQAWRASTTANQAAGRAQLQRLGRFSQHRLHEITRSLRLEFERCDGALLLLRTARDLARLRPRLALLGEDGVRFELLDAAACHAAEPGLDRGTPLHAGLRLPDAEAGNCRQFAHLLRVQAQRLGVQFRFHTQVEAIIPGATPQLRHRYAPADEAVRPGPRAARLSGEGPATEPMAFDAATDRFDAIVVCAGVAGAALLAPLRLPLLAIGGYSVTAPLRQRDELPDAGPRGALIDARHGITLTRLGQRVRVAGGAEVATGTAHDAGVLATLYAALNDWFPGAARMDSVQPWKDARPVLPDGLPVLGPAGVEGVWLNLGHGDSGWALACGSASVLADRIAGREPAVDTAGLGIGRLRR